MTGSSEETLPEVALCSASVTPQTLGPLRWAGPGRSTYWFFWWEKGVGPQACQHAVQQVSDCCHSRSARGRSRTCNCVPCPGRALPTAYSPSGRGGCHQETDCAGRWKIEASYIQMTAEEATNQVLKCKQFKGKVMDIQPGIKFLLCSHVSLWVVQNASSNYNTATAENSSLFSNDEMNFKDICYLHL